MRPPNRPTEFSTFKKLIATPELPDLGPGPRFGIEPIATLAQKLDTHFDRSNLPRAAGQLLRAAALLWHDHHEEAHRIAQEDESPEGSFLHGILHRREPDSSNAKYWFRRVGKHPSFSALAEEVKNFLGPQPDPKMHAKLFPHGTWDPFGFIDFCDRAVSLPSSDPLRKQLQQIQALEFDTLIAYLFERGLKDSP